ncbi:DNA-binding protein [Pseudomonas fluorescens]|nr:DNA-binding protein [Pseudomonas fluorescens]
MNNVIPFEYLGQPVRFSVNGWLHATKLADRFGKRIDHWLDNADTLEYIQALDELLTGVESKILDTRNSGYVKTSKARADRGGGTWLHPKLAIHFARWLSAKFSVWCDARVEEILHRVPSALEDFNRTCKKFNDRKSLASAHGRGLWEWQRDEPTLSLEVELKLNLLQMTLELNRPDQPRLQASS